MNYGNLSSYHPNWSHSAMYDSPSYILPVSVSYMMCNERAHKPRGEAPSLLLLYLIIFIKIPLAQNRGLCLLATLKLCPFIWHCDLHRFTHRKKIPLFPAWRGVFFLIFLLCDEISVFNATGDGKERGGCCQKLRSKQKVSLGIIDSEKENIPSKHRNINK